MKKILWVLAFFLPMVSTGHCEAQSLQLTIKSDKEVYAVGEEINTEATIKNTSHKEAKIYSPDYAGVSEIVVKDSKGFQNVGTEKNRMCP